MGGGTWLRRLGWRGTWDWGPPRPCATLLPPIIGFTFYAGTRHRDTKMVVKQLEYPVLQLWITFVWMIRFFFFFIFCDHHRSEVQDPVTTSSSSARTHLPRGPGTRTGRRWPGVKTGERLSRIGRGEIHALIGGKLVRGLAIVSSGRNRQLQKQGRVHSRWTASTEGAGSASAATEQRRRKEKRRTRVNLVQEKAERDQRVHRGAEERRRMKSSRRC